MRVIKWPVRFHQHQKLTRFPIYFLYMERMRNYSTQHKRRCFEVLGFDEYTESHGDGLQILRYNLTTAYSTFVCLFVCMLVYL